MKKYLTRVILLVLFLSFFCCTVTPAFMLTTNTICKEPRSLKTQVYRSPLLPTIGLVWLDRNCDNICDEVLVFEYLGKDTDGKPIFNPVGVLTCEEADQFHRDAEKNTKNRSI